jgi:hypothetical protein
MKWKGGKDGKKSYVKKKCENFDIFTQKYAGLRDKKLIKTKGKAK